MIFSLLSFIIIHYFYQTSLTLYSFQFFHLIWKQNLEIMILLNTLFFIHYFYQTSLTLDSFTNGITDGNIPSVIPSRILTVKGSCHCTEIPIWIPGKSVGKIAPKNFHVIHLFFFSKILNSPSVILSVYTDIITKGFAFVGKYHRKLPTKKFCR
jgi:hypothetical protein